MATLKLLAGALRAAADRTIEGMLLPYGEVGRTNLGRVSIKAGAIDIPGDPVVVTLNKQHDPTDPVGRCTAITNGRKGIAARFTIANTPEGDAVLAEVERGERNMLSAEVSDIVIRDGVVVSGKLYAAAAVERGAFPSATMLAADVGDDEKSGYTEDSTITTTTPDGEVITTEVHHDETVTVATDNGDDPDAEDQPTDEEEDEEDPVTTLAAAAPRSLGTRPAGRVSLKAAEDLYAAMATAHSKIGGRAAMLAALDQVVQADAEKAQQPGWLGEIWAGKTYEPKVLPLLTQATLTGMHAVGWKFVEGKTPTVGDWSGFPKDVTSTEVKTEAVTLDAKRLAGANEIDRAFRDFSVPEFWEGYYREQASSYARQIDRIATNLVLDPASHTIVDAGAVPEGISPAASMIVDGALKIIAAEIDLPTFALVGMDLYRDFLLTRKDDALEYLTIALGLEAGDLAGFRVVPSTDTRLAGKVAVGTRSAATVFQLPGCPIRIETISVLNGGIQDGVFGYYATLSTTAKGIALVGPTTPAPPAS